MSSDIQQSTKEHEFINLEQGGPVRVYVKDGKIVRVRPIIFGPEDEKSKSWQIRVGDKVFSPPRRFSLAPYALASRRMVYAENRILHPMKRVDFDPQSTDRKTQERGKSGYVSISWDEALDIVSNEMKRIRSKYGAPAITGAWTSHHFWGLLNYRFSAFKRFFNILGYTEYLENADSWEVWVWGATHVYGNHWKMGLPDNFDLLEDALKNSELIVHWGSDPETSRATYGGQEAALWRYWLKQLGKKQIFIDPFCNYSASIYADQWIAPRPGTDTALALAIAFTWLKEGTYDKEYVKTHTFGFDKWVDYVTGKEDKIAKTPEWAAEITGVPARIIRALAREWGSKKTMLGAGSGSGRSSICRQAYGHEWTRMMVLLVGMQGLGKPGVNLFATSHGAPMQEEFKFPGYADGGMNQPGVPKKVFTNPVKQMLNRLVFADAILNPPARWMGNGFNIDRVTQFKSFQCPMPAPDGAPIKMYYCYGPSNLGTLPGGNKKIEAYRSPNLEFVVCQAPFFEGEAKFADVILPACTNFERDDIAEVAQGGGYVFDHFTSNNHRIILNMQKCIEPLGESKSDYDIFVMLAEKMGIKDEYTEGNTVDDWLRKIYENSDMKKVMPWEQFKKKGYYVLPFPDRHVSHRAMGSFYATGTGLVTPSGKIEFYAQTLANFDKNDKERLPVPHYIESWEGHRSPEAKRYPLQLISPHPKYSFHTQQDHKVPWLSEAGGRFLKDGYYWWPIRMNPKDAESRNIKHHDIVKVYNDRAAVMCIAILTERMREGVVHSYCSSSKYDPITTDNGIADKGGCVNLLTPTRMMSKNASGFAPNSCLVQIEKWMEA